MAVPRVPLMRNPTLQLETLCEHCTAKCCKYYALALDKPTEERDWDFMRWYLLHGETCLFTEDGTWYLLVYTTCKHLQPDQRCGIYETRPEICREYSTDNCEFDEHYVYERYFETPEQVDEYMDALFPKRGRKGIRSAKPELLPVVG